MFILYQHDNSTPRGQGWKMFFLHQSYVSVNFNLDLYWSDYFPGLTPLAGDQNLPQITGFTPELLQNFGTYTGVTF